MSEFLMAVVTGVISGLISGWLIWKIQSEKQWRDRDVEKLYGVLNNLVAYRELLGNYRNCNAEAYEVEVKDLRKAASAIAESALVLVHEEYAMLSDKLHDFTVRSIQEIIENSPDQINETTTSLRGEATSLFKEVWNAIVREKCPFEFSTQKRTSYPKAINQEGAPRKAGQVPQNLE